MREYNALVQRLDDLPGNQVQRRVLGQVEGYPIYHLRIGQTASNPTVLLIGGTHGDEPAGVEALLDLAVQVLPDWSASFNFEAIPCLNPTGYVHNRRNNAQNADINWSWGRPDVAEFQLFHRLVQDRRFVFTMDFHEDWESPGFYLYTVCRRGPEVGPAVIQAVASVCPINRGDEIEGLPAVNGVITPDPVMVEQARGEGIPTGLLRHHTDHFMVTETPTAHPMACRVQAHKAALDTVLGLYKPRSTD